MTLIIWASGVVLMVLWLASRGGVVTWWHYLVAFIFSGTWFLISMIINVLIGIIKTKRFVREYADSQHKPSNEVDRNNHYYAKINPLIKSGHNEYEKKDNLEGSPKSFEKIQCLINTNDFLSDLFEKRTAISIESLDNMNDVIFKMISTITPREEKVLTLKYGLFDNNKLPYKEIAEKLGTSKETIRRYEKKAMTKMRHPSRFTRIKKIFS